MHNTTSAKPTLKRRLELEASASKQPKTSQTGISNFSSAQPEIAPDASDTPDPSPLDIPAPAAETEPQTNPLITPSMFRQPAMQTDQIISVHSPVLIPELLPDLIRKIFTLAVPHVNPLRVEPYQIMQESAKPMVALTRVNQRAHKQFAGTLAIMRWTYLLARHFDPNQVPHSDPVASSINALVDTAAYLPALPQAPARHTVALMIASWRNLGELYTQLHARFASGGSNLASQIDWNQLPVHAIMVGALMFGQESDAFKAFAKIVFDSLPDFGPKVRAQVCAEVAIFDVSRLNALKELKTKEADAELERLRHFKALVHGFKTAEHHVNLFHIGQVFQTLPPAGECWNLSAIGALGFLSNLPYAGILTSEQSQTLRDRTEEMLLHFMSLARPDAQNHPVTNAARNISTEVVLEAFMQLSLQEKVKLLEIFPIGHAIAFVDRLAQSAHLSTLEKLDLIEDLLSQTEIHPFIKAKLMQCRDEFLPPTGQL